MSVDGGMKIEDVRAVTGKLNGSDNHLMKMPRKKKIKIGMG